MPGHTLPCLRHLLGMRRWSRPMPGHTAVFEAFAGHEKMEQAKQFLDEIKANGFVADRKAMKAMRHVLKGSIGHVVRTIADILFDDPEDYSDYSDDDDDVIKKISKEMDWSRFPPDSYLSFCKKQIIENDPENPKDLEDVFDTMRKADPVTFTMARMINMLRKDRFMSQAEEIFVKMDLDRIIPEVVTHTGVIEIYAKAYEAKEALKVFVRMLSLGVTPNAYTYSVLIKGLAKDPNFLGDAKKYTLEMMDKGMQPNARTYIAVFKAFARLKDFNVEKGKEFLKEMKAKGFVPKKKAVMEVLKGKKRTCG
ncbi:pentatricopeptide repeat-containing protein At4g38150-like [Rosa rugosa]|uniref:pentatricopeptide repeat-containing protein At4g38150-like n=1 Tax=Rosa rugosa TaxID=74645 RepID=UPI002B40E7E2|nr:pentatricopeptide repeat-containing protein At4g38150-like [Rosa rugosa]